jgi:outer membrane receptor protein involved in Fe transport
VRRAIALVLAFNACLVFEQSGSAQPAPPPVTDADAAVAPLDPDAGVAEDPTSDAAVVEPSQAPAPEIVEPAPTTGVIEGTVTSLENGAPVAAAKVYVRGEPLEAETGTDGRFTLSVPPGVHRISVIHGFHDTQTADVEAVAGQTVTVTLQLTPAQLEYADFLVTAPRIKGTVASVLEERRESAAVVDAISVADISRSPDGTASAATRRIVGATIVGGQYLYVRGLGGRYVNVRLNGVPLPSTDPDLPGFQLDLFPASLLSSLSIAKTFTPDIPGDFAGGSMNVVTRDFPDDFTLTASVGLGTTTETLSNRIIGYEGGDTDFLGFDDGTRDLPSELEDRRLAVEGQRNPDGFEEDEFNRVGGEFPRVVPIEERGFFPNTNISLSVGDSVKIAGRRLGFLVSLGYRYSLQASSEVIQRVEEVNDVLQGYDFSRNDQTTEKALIGALGALSYELAQGHKLGLVSMFTQSADDRTTYFSQEDSQLDMGLRVERSQFRFIERQLFFNQLLGHHDFEAVLLDWQLNASSVKRDQPNTIDIQRRGPLPGEVVARGGSGERLFSDLDQLDLGGGADVTVPIEETKLKAGYMGRFGDREFGQRTFVPDDIDGAPVDRTNEDFFAPRNSGRFYEYDEGTLRDDAYVAEEELHAGYLMIDTPMFGDLRLIAGARVESMRQFLDPGSEFVANESMMPNTNRTTTDVLPAAALTYAFTEKMSVRAAYGGTVARPIVRELALVYATDHIRRRSVIGNPELDRTYIHNFDLRWEVFPSDVEVLAASVFYKVFKHPIESVITMNGDFSFQNVDGAENYGLELEARVGLDRLLDSLEDLSVGANFALISSNVEISEEVLAFATSPERPMAGQSPYVANLSLGYTSEGTGLSLNLFYNVFGPRLRDVGTNPLPDTYEEPFHSVDLSAAYKLGEHFTLGASAQNLLLQTTKVTQGDIVISEIDEGLTLGVSLGFKN